MIPAWSVCISIVYICRSLSLTGSAHLFPCWPPRPTQPAAQESAWCHQTIIGSGGKAMVANVELCILWHFSIFSTFLILLLHICHSYNVLQWFLKLLNIFSLRFWTTGPLPLCRARQQCKLLCWSCVDGIPFEAELFWKANLKEQNIEIFPTSFVTVSLTSRKIVMKCFDNCKRLQVCPSTSVLIVHYTLTWKNL